MLPSISPNKNDSHGMHSGSDPEAVHFPKVNTTADSPSEGHSGNAQLSSDAIDPANRIPLEQRDLLALATLLDPPSQFISQVDLNIRYLDLRWLRALKGGSKVVPKCSANLLNMREDLLDRNLLTCEGEDAILLDSPRSIITLLRNGVKAERLQYKSLRLVNLEGGLEGISPELCERRFRHIEQNRLVVLHTLRQQYSYLRATYPLRPIFDWFRAFFAMKAEPPPAPGEGGSPTIMHRKSPTRSTGSGNESETASPTLQSNRSPELRPSSRHESIHSATSPAERRRMLVEQKKDEMDRLAQAALLVKNRFIEHTHVRTIGVTEKAKVFEESFATRLAEQKKVVVARALESEQRAETKRQRAEELLKTRRARLEELQNQREARDAEKRALIEQRQKQRREEAQHNASKVQLKLEASRQRQLSRERRHRIALVEAERRTAQKAEERKQLQELKMKQVQQQALEKAKHRELILKQSLENQERKRMEAESSQEREAQRIRAFLAMKHNAAKDREKSSEMREQKRRAVIEMASQRQEAMQTSLLERARMHEELCRKQNEDRMQLCQTRKEEMREQQRDKYDFLEREQNKLAFYKLAVIDNIQRKMDRIEENTRQQQEMVRETKHYSETVAAGREKKIRAMDDYFIQQQKRVFFASHNNLPLPRNHLPDELIPRPRSASASPSRSQSPSSRPLSQSVPTPSSSTQQPQQLPQIENDATHRPERPETTPPEVFAL